MKKSNIKNIKRLKAIFGLVTAAFSLALAIQQVMHLREGDLDQA
jgi:hypothetical protein